MVNGANGLVREENVALLASALGIGEFEMDYQVEEIQPDVWRVEAAGTTRIIRRVPDSRTFMPWDILTGDGHQRLWAASSLHSAFRWIQARTGLPTEALLAEGLLEQTASQPRSRHKPSQNLTEGDLRLSVDAAQR
jgi:hypothetical protein